MKRFHTVIEGISPYLMHKFSGTDEKSKSRTGTKNYKDETEKALYRDPSGKVYVPSSQIHGCLIGAGRQLQVVGKGKATYGKLFGAFVMIEPAVLTIKPQKYTVDERPVVVQKARIIRYRPKWEQWSLEFDVVIMDEDIASEVVKQALDNGGRYVGIGDFRPSKGGSFGRFQVTEFKEIK